MLHCTDLAVLQLVNELESVVIIELGLLHHVLDLVPVGVAKGLMQPDDLLFCKSFVEFLVFEFLRGLYISLLSSWSFCSDIGKNWRWSLTA